MSNKANAPKGYNSKTVAQLQQESQNLLFQLGQALYNEAFSRREQDRIQDELTEMEDKLRYAQKAENAKQVEDNNKKVREEASKSTSTGESDAKEVSNTGA